jgi:phytoene desaturase
LLERARIFVFSELNGCLVVGKSGPSFFMSLSNSKVLVVGAGIAGLAAAIRLRAAGHEVMVFDQNPYVGGKLAECIADGYRFDMGPSLFTMPAYVEELFALCCKDIQRYFSYTREDVLCKYHFEDGTRFTAYADREKYIREACSTFDVQPSVLRNYLERNTFKYERTRRLFLEKSLHRLSTYLSRETIRGVMAMPRLDMMRSLHDVHRRTFKDSRLIQLFDRYATYNGSTPYRAPGIMSLIPHLEMDIGTYFPKGGMIAIPRALHRLALDIGVKFELGSRVDEMVVQKNRVVGIRIGAETITADIVVCNSDVHAAYTNLLPNIPPPRKVMQQERSSSGIIFYWGVQRKFPELQLHNIFFAKDYRREFDWIAENGEWHNDPTVYLNITSKKEDSDAPAGCENWFVMINVPARSEKNWDTIVQLARQAVIDKLSRQLGVDLGKLIACERVLTPALIEQRTSSYLGALYGSASNDRMSAFLRHPNFHSTIDGLYFCGGSVHPGGGIPLCLLSGKIVSEIIASRS